MASSSAVILLDEPELHLEPRVVRRLFKFLIWFLTREKPNKNTEEETIFNQVEMVLHKYVKDTQPLSKLTDHHPNQEYKQKQLFIASHSPILINEFISLKSLGSIYEFDSKFTQIKKQKMPSPIPGVEDTETRDGTYSTVRKIDSDALTILDNLGVKGSDILQTNGIIWVEGPSDIVYIQKWLEMYTTENSLPEFRQGSNFEFCMFGGAVLKYLYGEEVQQGTKQENLVNIFKLNTRGFIIVDSDKPDLTTEDKSTFAEAKQLMKNTLGEDQFWCDSEVQTIEKYAIENTEKTWRYHLNCKYDSEGGKPERSFKRVQLWNNKEIMLSDFEPSLLPNIKKLYEAIKEWNRQ
jgi:AAA domain, putative AbiEii toxin, Type IV TA system